MLKNKMMSIERIKRTASISIIFVIGIYVIVNEESSKKSVEVKIENKKVENKTRVLASSTKTNKSLYTIEK